MLDKAIAAASGALIERQSALAALGELGDEQADVVLGKWLDKLNAGDLPANLWLDVTMAAGQRENGAVKERLAAYEASRPTDDPLAQYRESLEGGDAVRGREIFYTRTAVSCVRCHTIGAEGTGGRVGPPLTTIAKDKDRRYLLESIATPTKTIAKGFELSNILLADEGRVVAGIVQSETDAELRLMDADGKLFTVQKDNIEARSQGPSAMPDNLIEKLSKADVRDLVEFLSQQK